MRNTDDAIKKTFLQKFGKEIPTNWNTFARENHIEFAEELKKFRGNDDLSFNSNLRGGEGQIFDSKLTNNKVLKRWFESRAKDFPESVRLLKEAKNIV